MHPGLYIGIGVLLIAAGAALFLRRTVPTDQAGRSIVRCSQGHLFETVWIPLASFKAIRLGPLRYQRCPVGHHYSLVRLVDPNSLTPEEMEQARSATDTWVP